MPTREQEEIRASMNRAAEREAETTYAEAREALFDAARKGGTERSSHPISVARICLHGFRNAAGAAVRRLAEIKGTDAPSLSLLLLGVLFEQARSFLKIYDEFAMPGQPSQL